MVDDSLAAVECGCGRVVVLYGFHLYPSSLHCLLVHAFVLSLFYQWLDAVSMALCFRACCGDSHLSGTLSSGTYASWSSGRAHLQQVVSACLPCSDWVSALSGGAGALNQAS